VKTVEADAVAAVFQTLAKVAATSSRVEKYNILASACRVGSFGAHQDSIQLILKEVVQYALNPNWVYRISAPTEFSASKKKLPANKLWTQFIHLLDDLRLGTFQVPLSRMKESIQLVLDLADQQTRPWLCMVLDRDLKIGFRQWNKLFPGILPEQKLMLCNEWDLSEPKSAMMCEPKLDGLRMLIVVNSRGECIPISRGGKPLWNLDHIFKEIKSSGTKNVVFDGEAFAGTFGDSISICKSQAPHPQATSLKFHIFDMISLRDYESDKCQCQDSLMKRKAHLHSLLFHNKPRPKHLIEVPYPLVRSVADISTRMTQYLEQGYEGCVLKDPKSKYVFARSDAWLKRKPTETCDLEVYDAKPGKAGTKLENTMGALFCKGTVNFRGKKFKVKVVVGGGFSDEWRDHFFKLYNKGILQGTVIEVKYQDCTEANLCEASRVPGAKYSLRFPRFMRLRDDK
jgi:hypothetical protein